LFKLKYKIGLFLTLIVIYSYGQESITIESLKLKGKVKDLHIENYIPSESLNESFEDEICSFNKQGKIINYKIRGIIPTDIDYKYNKEHKLVSFKYLKVYGCESTEEIFFSKDYKTNTSIKKEITFNTSSMEGEQLVSTAYARYKNDLLAYKKIKGNKKAKEIFYKYLNDKISTIKMVEGEDITNIVYKYTPEEEKISYYLNKKLTDTRIITYNDFNLPVKEVFDSGDSKTERTYEYKYDEKGNFIEKTTFEKGEIFNLEKRKITYYKD